MPDLLSESVDLLVEKDDQWNKEYSPHRWRVDHTERIHLGDCGVRPWADWLSVGCGGAAATDVPRRFIALESSATARRIWRSGQNRWVAIIVLKVMRRRFLVLSTSISPLIVSMWQSHFIVKVRASCVSKRNSEKSTILQIEMFSFLTFFGSSQERTPLIRGFIWVYLINH